MRQRSSAEGGPGELVQAMPRKKPFSVKQKKKQLQDKRERKRGQCGSRRRGRGSDSRTSGRRGVPAAPLGGVGGGAGGARVRVGGRGGDSLAAVPLGAEDVGQDGEWGRGMPPAGGAGGSWRELPHPHTHPRGSWTGWLVGQGLKSIGGEVTGNQPTREGGLWVHWRWRHWLLHTGFQDGLRSSSNSRSGSRERREEQTDTSDGESVTHHIRRLNQQPAQGLGPRVYDPNR